MRNLSLVIAVGGSVTLIQGFAPTAILCRRWPCMRTSGGGGGPGRIGASSLPRQQSPVSTRAIQSAPIRANSHWQCQATPVETAGEGSEGAAAEAQIDVESGNEEAVGVEKKLKKKRAPRKKAAKKEEEEPEDSPLLPRHTINVADLSRLDQGFKPIRPTEYPDGWEWVEEEEEADEDEVPYWSGPDPNIDEKGKLKGVSDKAARTTQRAVLTRDKDEGVKVPTDTEFHWYVLKCFATRELKVLSALESFISFWGFDDRVKELYVPLQPVPRTTGRSLKFKESPMHPGYIYCHVMMDEEMRDKVNDMDFVVGFMGKYRDEKKKRIPEPMDAEDIDVVKVSEREINGKAPPKLFQPGTLVEIVEGSFATKKGELTKVKQDEYTIKVNTFGRNTDVKVSWKGARELSEVEQENWFEETRRALDASYADKEREREEKRQARYAARAVEREEGDGGRFGSGGEPLRGFGAGDDDASLAARRFMEKDMALFNREAKEPSLRQRRPSGRDIDEQLPEKAFESDQDANDFFDGLDSILSGDERKLPVLPGARVQARSVVERAHASTIRPTSPSLRTRNRRKQSLPRVEVPKEPVKAFKSDQEAKEFFDGLGDLLCLDESKLSPQSKSQIAKIPLVKQRAAAAAAAPKPPASSSARGDSLFDRNTRIQEKGRMNRAPVETEVSRVSTDVWTAGRDGEMGSLDKVEDVSVTGGGGAANDDDFFVALMHDLKESEQPKGGSSSKTSSPEAKSGDGFNVSPPRDVTSQSPRRNAGTQQRQTNPYGDDLDDDTMAGAPGGTTRTSSRATPTVGSAGIAGSNTAFSGGPGDPGQLENDNKIASSRLEELLAELDDFDVVEDGAKGGKTAGAGPGAVGGDGSMGGSMQGSSAVSPSSEKEIEEHYGTFAYLGVPSNTFDDLGALTPEASEAGDARASTRVSQAGDVRRKPLPSLESRSDERTKTPPIAVPSTPPPPKPAAAKGEGKQGNVFSDLDLLPEREGGDPGYGKEWAQRFDDYEDDDTGNRGPRQQNWNQNRNSNRNANPPAVRSRSDGGDRFRSTFAGNQPADRLAGKSEDQVSGHSSFSSWTTPRTAMASSTNTKDGVLGNGGSASQISGNSLTDSVSTDSTQLPPSVEGSEKLTETAADVSLVHEHSSSGSEADTVRGMKVVELKAKCKELGLPFSGNKAVLVDRILNVL